MTRLLLFDVFKAHKPCCDLVFSILFLHVYSKCYNVENSSFPAGTCAERTAIVHAVASGEKRLVAMAIVGGANGVNRDYCAPCGVCRQVMREFGNPREVLVVMAKSPDDYVEKTLEELLPMSFGPDNLK